MVRFGKKGKLSPRSLSELVKLPTCLSYLQSYQRYMTFSSHYVIDPLHVIPP
ncbi:hypothetical protein DVH24_002203 [Malus domestica]|uniref:Uncharacterized protein n=1 Tax=Malus domestica TaxID=3750 RepID=A0A498I9N5_MALDO|nr:hypothetical protein DVH24_002203 [Malus domestica]